MGKRLVFSTITFILAFGVLFASIFRSASVKYAFSQEPTRVDINVPKVDYQLPGTGLIGPDDPFWLFEVARDKVRLETTLNANSKSEFLILLADKRIAYAEQLAHRGNYEESIATAKKASMYLETAYNFSVEHKKNPEHLAISSLKHRQVLEEMYTQAPEDARPAITNIIDTTKKVYEKSIHMLNENGSPIVENPFSK